MAEWHPFLHPELQMTDFDINLAERSKILPYMVFNML